MKNMKSWKTTLTGIAAIVATAVAHFFPEHTETVVSITGVLVGLGFIAARDNDVSSEKANAK
mgnify:CR=1 FL=1